MSQTFGPDFYSRALALVDERPKVPTSAFASIDINQLRGWGERTAEFLLDVRFLIDDEFYAHPDQVADIVEFLTQALTTVADRLFDRGDHAHQQMDYALSEAYWHLLGVDTDTTAAHRYFLRSGKSPSFMEEGVRRCGSIARRYSLAERYAQGVGVEPDMPRARALFEGIDDEWTSAADDGCSEGDRLWASATLLLHRDDEDLAIGHKMAVVAWRSGFYPAATTVALYEKRRGVVLSADEDRTEPSEEEEEVSERTSLEEELAKLDAMIGLNSVKAQLKRLVAFENVQALRRKRGLASQAPSRHLVLTGNPGTGKTTVARLLARIYHRLGVLESDVLVETDRSGLVGGFLGQTAIITTGVIESAIGGVLFIDEAYSLASESDDSYGLEAINTLLKAMEDRREELVVVVAGYTDRMEQFLLSNPGLSSRFNMTISFEDYSPSERVQILIKCATDGDYQIEEDGLRYAVDFFERDAGSPQSTGNGRLVRNFYEALVDQHACRLDQAISQGNRITTSALTTLSASDVHATAERFGYALPALAAMKTERPKIRAQKAIGMLVGQAWSPVEPIKLSHNLIGEIW